VKSSLDKGMRVDVVDDNILHGCSPASNDFSCQDNSKQMGIPSVVGDLPASPIPRVSSAAEPAVDLCMDISFVDS